MKLITQQQKNASVAERWKAQHFKYHLGGYDLVTSVNGKTKQQIYDELIALENPSKEEIDTIIGNSSWTDIIDYESGEKVDAAVVFEGDEEDCVLGEDALRKALKLIEDARGVFR